VSNTPQDEVPELKLPDWLPFAAKLAAEKVYQRKLNEGTSDDIYLLNRLTADERMKRVWTTLTSERFASSKSKKTFANPMLFYFNCLARAKRKKAAELRKRGGDFNQATAQLLEGEADRLDRPPTEAPDAWPEQDCAIYCFFYGAYSLARDLQPILSREELRNFHNDYLRLSKQLRDSFEKLRFLGMDYYADLLAPIILEVDQRERFVDLDLEDSGTSVVERPRRARLRSYVVQLALITCVIFGDQLRGTLAVTANVALNLQEPVKGPTVRRPPGFKGPQKALVGEQVRTILRSNPYTALGGESAIPWD
jgi:hypothetical protein